MILTDFSQPNCSNRTVIHACTTTITRIWIKYNNVTVALYGLIWANPYTNFAFYTNFLQYHGCWLA